MKFPLQVISRNLAITSAMLFAPVAGAAQAPDSLDLETAVARAVALSPEIQRAEAEAARIGAGKWESWGALLPSLDLTLGLNESQVLQRTASDPLTGGIIALPDSLIDLRESFGTSAALSAGWTIFDGGRRYWGIRETNAAAHAASMRVDAARVRLAAGVSLAYLDALEAAFQVNVRQAEVERARKLTETAEVRFEIGEAPELDVLQARLAETDAELALLEAEDEAEAARLALFQHLQLEGDRPIVLAEPEALGPVALPPQEELRACVLERSSELQALQAERDAAQERMAAESWSSALPSVRFGATWIRSEFGQTRDAITFEPRNEQTYYTLQFSWTPLQSPGGFLAQRQRARASLAVAEAEIAARRPAIIRDVEVSLGRLRRARILVERAELSAELVERQLEHASERYRLGVGSLTESLQAEALARESERQRVTARFAALRALAELERSTGTRLQGARCAPELP